MTDGDPLLIAIVGPTGSGKTALSLAITERFGGEIVNCDSVAIYREFEIGTAKPAVEERECVRYLRFNDPLRIVMNSRTSQGVIFKPAAA